MQKNKLKIIFTVDGDWLEYIRNQLPAKDKFIQYLHNEIEFAKEFLDGKLLHLIHFSPLSKFYFLEPEFIPFYREIESIGGNIGVHFHMDIPLKKYNLFKENIDFMKEAIKKTKDQGLTPVAHRGGYFSYANELTKILEENGIYVELSNIPDRKFVFNNMIVSDWTGSERFPYKLDYNNFKKKGNAKVWGIPVASYENNYLYIENINVKKAKNILDYIEKGSHSVDNLMIFSTVTHSYFFPPVFYNEHFNPFSNNFSRNRYIYKFCQIMSRFIENYNILNKIFRIKRISFNSLFFKNKFKNIIIEIKKYAYFINAIECLDLLKKNEKIN